MTSRFKWGVEGEWPVVPGRAKIGQPVLRSVEVLSGAWIESECGALSDIVGSSRSDGSHGKGAETGLTGERE